MAQTGIDDIVDNFDFLDDWEDRYRYVIELGKLLEPISEDERSAANKVEGCVSQVWLVLSHASDQEAQGSNVLTYRGDSDALIVKGLVAILVALFTGKSAAEITATDALAVFDKIGLREHLTPQRSNGLVAMVERVKRDAARLA